MNIICKTLKQTLKCYNLLFLNMGYSGKLNINGYEKCVNLEKVLFKHQINNLINLIKKQGLKYEEIILTTIIKQKKTEIIN